MKKTYEEKKQIAKDRVSNVLNGIINLFETGKVPKVIANVIFPPTNIPAIKWSLCNKLSMIAQGTYDARGYKQWKKAGRNVQKGGKAIYIFAPKMVTKKVEEGNEKEYMLVGFSPIAVFPVEKTEGEPLKYEQQEIPKHPLSEKAKEWGIDIKSTNFFGDFLGFWQKTGLDNQEKIRLCTPQEKTFFHELAHAAHYRTFSKDEYDTYRKKNNSRDKMEIVAELSAQVLAQLVGTELESTVGNTYQYILAHCKDGQSAGKACMEVVADVEKVLNLILDIK